MERAQQQQQQTLTGLHLCLRAEEGLQQLPGAEVIPPCAGKDAEGANCLQPHVQVTQPGFIQLARPAAPCCSAQPFPRPPRSSPPEPFVPQLFVLSLCLPSWDQRWEV